MPDYDVFLSYRREGGDALSQLLYTRLTQDGYAVFYDVETMRSGKFDEQILRSIDDSRAIVAVLPPKALDRCADPEDWVRRELEYAIGAGRLVIPVMMKGFRWPAELPAGLRELPDFQGITADFNGVFDTWYEKLKTYIGRPAAPKAEAQAENPLLELGRIALEDEDFGKADSLFDEILRTDPHCAKAWLGKAMVGERARKPDDLAAAGHLLSENRAFLRALQYADTQLRPTLENRAYQVKKRLSQARAAAKPAGSFWQRLLPGAGKPPRRSGTDLAIGDPVNWGRFPQKKGGGEPEPIRWVLLDREGDKALLLSRYILDCRPFHEEKKPVTWADCSLRAWLNGPFFRAAFSEAEQARILVSELDNSPAAQGYATWPVAPCPKTRDRLFLLSQAEIIRYFDHDIMAGFPSETPYAAEHRLEAGRGYKTTDWVLRTTKPAKPEVYLANPRFVLGGSRSVDSRWLGVRPAMWVRLNG